MNEIDYGPIFKKLDDHMKEISELSRVVSCIATKIEENHKHLTEKFGDIKEQQDDVNTVLYGNGHPGVIRDLIAAQAEIKKIGQIETREWYLVGAFVLGILGWVGKEITQFFNRG